MAEGSKNGDGALPTGESGDGGDPPLEDHLEWIAFPVRDNFPASLLLPAFIVVFSMGVGVVLAGPGWGLLSFGVLFGATFTYFLPTRYRIDQAGVRAGRTKRTWVEIRNVYLHKDGAFLSPFPRPSRLDPFRGVHLRYHKNRAAVEQLLVRYRVDDKLSGGSGSQST